MARNNLTKKKRIFSIWFHKEIGTEKESKQCGSHQFFSLLFFCKESRYRERRSFIAIMLIHLCVCVRALNLNTKSSCNSMNDAIIVES